jgi:uncharacterized membrane protein
VPVGRSGYIQEVDVDALGRWAIERRLTVVFRLPKGRHMVAGSTLAFVWGETGVDPGEITDVVNRGVVIAVERRVDDDPGFGIRQLVDIALKAVAPSMNDPYTAVQAIQHLSVVLSELARVATQDIAVVEDGVVRVHVPVPDFAVHMETVCSNVRLTAAHRPRIMLALLRLLEVVGSATTSDERRQVIARHVELVVSDSERLIENAYDLEPLHAAARDVERALGRS